MNMTKPLYLYIPFSRERIYFIITVLPLLDSHTTAVQATRITRMGIAAYVLWQGGGNQCPGPGSGPVQKAGRPLAGWVGLTGRKEPGKTRLDLLAGFG